MSRADGDAPASDGVSDAPGGTGPEVRPAVPRPAATLVLLRDGPTGPEALLVRRAPSAGFVPGTHVFPGGVVDTGDASEAAAERWDGLAPAEARRRLGLQAGSAPPAFAYFVAAVRETFEETGLLAGADGAALRDDAVRRGRAALLEGRSSFAQVLRDLGARIDGQAFAYVARWTTPPSVARRYDTRFFAAVAPRAGQAAADERETTEAAWLTPVRALALRAEGGISMIFPTVSTLQDCLGFASAAELVSHLRSRRAVAQAPASPLPEERGVLEGPPGAQPRPASRSAPDSEAM